MENNGTIDTREAAKILGVAQCSVRSIVQRGLIPAIKGDTPGPRGGVPPFVLRREDVVQYRETRVRRDGWRYGSRTPADLLAFKAMLVGGPKAVATKTARWLSQNGVAVLWHTEYKTNRVFNSPIPIDCELVILLKDMLGHTAIDNWVKRVKGLQKMGRNIDYVRVTRKKLSQAQALRGRGYFIEGRRIGTCRPTPYDDGRPVTYDDDPPVKVDKDKVDLGPEDLATHIPFGRNHTPPPAALPIGVVPPDPGTATMRFERAGALANALQAIAQIGTVIQEAGIRSILITSKEVEIEYAP